MYLKKYFNIIILTTCSSSFFVNAAAYAETSNRNLDIYGNVGYTALSGFSFNKTKKFFHDFSGVNFGVSALYSLNEDYNFKPVLGTSLSITRVSNSNKSPDLSEVSSIDGTFTYATIAVNGGIKFYPFDLFKIYALANFGYAPSNRFDAKYNSSNALVSTAVDKAEYKIKNHYYYGATLMGTYKFGEMFSLGGSFSYNRHNMTLDYIPQTETITESSAFNEYSANIVAMWSI